MAFMLLSTLVTGIFFLTITESFSLLELSYEAVSAIATVGLTMGITSNLSMIGKVIIIVLMYFGRIGPLTVLLSINRKQASKKGQDISYPTADILIG